MIEVTILNYLNDKLSVPCFMEHQRSTDLAEYVVLERTGGSNADKVNTVTFAIQSYASSMYNAAVLNESVKSAMESAHDLAKIASVTLNSDYNFTDTTKKQYRYQAVFRIVFTD